MYGKKLFFNINKKKRYFFEKVHKNNETFCVKNSGKNKLTIIIVYSIDYRIYISRLEQIIYLHLFLSRTCSVESKPDKTS